MEFNEALVRWQPFFTAVAGVAATLAGLLFISLSINREKITAKENRILMRVARRSFGDMLFALFIALMFLIPAHEHMGLGIPLSIVAAFRVVWLIRMIARSGGDTLEIPLKASIREHLFQILSVLGLMTAGIEIFRGEMIAIFLIVPVIALLLCNASLNAWLLLILEQEAKPNKTAP